MTTMILMRCPTTNQTVATGLLVDSASFATLRHLHAPLQCPECGGTHEWHDTPAWLGRVINGRPLPQEHADIGGTPPGTR
jgi:hypothetical protein